MASTARTPRVQLVLNLRDDGPQEKVLCVTSGHEVVEARHGGVAFQFSRKRKSSAAAAAPASAAAPTAGGPARSTCTQRASLYRTPAAARALSAVTAATAAVAAESPYADELEMPRALGERLVEGLQALPERASPADRLLAICASIGAAAAEAAAQPPPRNAGNHSGSGGKGSSARAAVLADALAAFQHSLAAALADGSVALAALPRPPATPAEEGEVEQQEQGGYQVDLEARKAGLRARLANFKKEEEEWHSLLQKVEQLDQQQLMAGRIEKDGAGEAAEAAADDGLLSSVATESAVYEQPSSQQAAGNGSAAAAPEDAELAVLERVHAGVHRQLAMQVEGVCKLVGDVEELVERANRSAAAVQAEYHAEKFRAFPHVDSPARLIRELVRLPGPAARAGASKAAPAAAAAATASGKENALAEAAAMEVA